jgi:hypothetical protein
MLQLHVVVPFPISLVMAFLVYFGLNATRMHIVLKRQGMSGGIKDLYKSMRSLLGDSWNNNNGSTGMAYSPITLYCINCGYEHKEDSCPKCGSKAVRTG